MSAQDRSRSIIRFMDDFLGWQIFGLLGAMLIVTSGWKLILSGDPMYNSYLCTGGLCVALAMWKYKAAKRGRKARSAPQWVDWGFVLVTLPPGITMLHQGNRNGWTFIVCGALLVLAIFMRKRRGTDGNDGGDGGNGPKGDDPPPWLKRLVPLTVMKNGSDN